MTKRLDTEPLAERRRRWEAAEALLRSHPAGLNTDELAKALGLFLSEVDRMMRHALQNRRVSKSQILRTVDNNFGKITLRPFNVWHAVENSESSSDSRRYACIFADPPWPADDQGSRIAPAHAGHYPVMSMAAVIGLGDHVRAWSEKNAHLWLAAPNYVVLDGDAVAVVRAWGFQPKQLLTWCKVSRSGRPKIGVGHWMRNSTEQILFCVRGRLPALAANVPTHVDAIPAEHSRKPDELFQLVEKVSPGPRLEMFARRAREGWASWGDQAPVETCIKPEPLLRMG